MTVPNSLEGFDVPGAVERMLGQPSIWWQAIALFVQHFSGWEKAWLASIGDDALERRQVHAVRGGAANVGALRLAASAADLERLLAQRLAGEPVEIPEATRRRLSEDFRQAWQSAADARQSDDKGASA